MKRTRILLLTLILTAIGFNSSAQVIQTLCSFAGTNGAAPKAALTLGLDGSFYGTTFAGGITNASYPTGMGTVFKVTTNGNLTTLVSLNGTNGAAPSAWLVPGSNGDFYSTTSSGGSNSYGTVFKITTDGTLITLVSFNYTNGSDPVAGLTMGNDGSFYGTTSSGGSTNNGTVFNVTSNGMLTPLASFAGANGANPVGGLVLGNDGTFYGTTEYGGPTNSGAGYGTIFQVTTNGALNSLVSFAGTNGAYPTAGLTAGADGNYYGTTYAGGGSGGNGTILRVTTNGILTSLLSFNNSNGAQPNAGLIPGSDGNFYGTTLAGGSANYGTVFRVTTNGTLTTLVFFSSTNGANPEAALTVGNDGRFYGTTSSGGSNGYGTVFCLLLPPVITIQPHSLINSAGSTAMFLVSATSLTPLSYQWQMNGTNLLNVGNVSGVTSNILSLTGISDIAVGTYSVIVSNSDGSVTSSNATLTVIDPPILTAQPSSLLAPAGSNATFGVSLTGTTPIRFQWQINGTNIFAATNATYTIFSVGTNNAGNYSVSVTNAAGGAMSSNAALTVVLMPRSQTNIAGSTATFTATAFGPAASSYQWQRNGTNLFDGGNVSGSTNGTLTIASVSDNDAANYWVMVSNAFGSLTSSIVTLTVIDPPIITAQPTNMLVLAGTNVTIGVSLTGSAPFFHYQWLFNSTNLLNATNAVYALSAVATNKAGNYSVVVTNAAGIAVSSNAALTVVLSPASRTNYASSTATFTVTAFSPESLTYQWQKNGTNLSNRSNISGATNSMLIIASLLDADAATYSAVVSDAATSVTTSNATLMVNDSLFIATQPLSQTIGVGSNVTFTITAYGAPPFIFQWYYTNSPAGPPVSGTNISSYSLTNVQTNQSGNYSVHVINGLGSLTSSNALLTVKVFPPIIGVQPTNQRVVIGSSATFVVLVGGTAPFVYHWRFNGTNILGATNTAYSIPVLVATNTGNYSVVITNSAGSVTSSNALLTVLIPPTMALKLLAGYPVLNLNGMVSNSFVVQYNTNLAGTNWITLLSLSNLLTSPYQFLDPVGSGQPARFYRSFMQ